MFALYFSKVLFLLIKTPPSKKILTNFKQLELSPNKSQDIRQKTKKLFELKMKRKLRVGGIEMGFLSRRLFAQKLAAWAEDNSSL